MKSLIAIMSVAVAFGAFAEAPKYVFLFIGDGMSIPQRMTAEEFSRKTGSGPLAMNALPYSATTRTCSADSLITDSAAAATAIACGEKTKNHYSGVDQNGEPLESCAVVAKRSGKKVGIASTVTITHATPAGFYAHRKDRGDAYGIALDLADSGFDFFAGGGLDVHAKNSKESPDYEKYGDAYDYAVSNGYRIVRTREEFLALKPEDGKILTRFTNGPLSAAIDVDSEVDEPSLDEIVTKAIEMLDNENGFFLMTEGGRIDWGGHANDAATNLRDVLALDKAVKVALAFQERHPDDTLVIVTGDHETGGMSMGFAATGYSLYVERLANQTMSVDKFEYMMSRLYKEKWGDGKQEVGFKDAKPLLSEAFGFVFPEEVIGADEEAKKNPMLLTRDEADEIRKAFDHDVEFHKSRKEENSQYDGEKRYLLGGTARLVLSHKSGIGWSSGAHTAMPVLTTAKGKGAEKFIGFIDNTDISKIIKGFYE